MLKSLKNYFLNLIYKYVVAETQDVLALQLLAPLSTTFLPWTGASLRPSAVVKILNLILMLRCNCIVECGSGISTFYIAKFLKHQNRGHLYSIEHDESWADLVQTILVREGLDAYVTLIIAPLVESSLSLDGSPWYDTQIIEKSLGSAKIDLLVVDGPPAFKPSIQYARYPAVPYFKSAFSERYAIVLDDVQRSGEKAIVQKWRKLLGLKFNYYLIDGGIAIACTEENFWIRSKHWDSSNKFIES